ncbi:hypothetical protein Krac_1868 [Ktedonobacter racemifer DSM 44963]|uniref:Uncharacterized protein n=1 Tax=Ktedonobacter racemifer DSM 44963 TaxID=485913 RepID=D6U3T2_KTERA|nr:hypothetical protein Krac_1868 [Ktedonobacter racemifer DSM 44963]
MEPLALTMRQGKASAGSLKSECGQTVPRIVLLKRRDCPSLSLWRGIVNLAT